MLPDRTTVLIVGAGPTGLAAALSLLRQGCRDLIIVDNVGRNDRPLSSRALAVHAATLEALDTIGCAEPLVKVGVKGKENLMWSQDGLQMSLGYDGIKGYTRHPYVLIVSQYSTEKILESKLREMGITVQTPYRLIGLNDAGDEGLIATFESGERIRTNYVLGADGARSAVRSLVNVGYADPDGENIEEAKQVQMVTADVTFTPALRLPRDQVNIFNGSGYQFILIPVPRSPWPESYDHLDDDIFRVGFTIPKGDGPPPHAPSADFLQKYIEKIRPTFLYSSSPSPTMKINKVLWSSRFRVHSAIADRFLVQLHSSQRKEACRAARAVFLMGDAAHIHSPIGGQGMNLGLRDAIGLGPVLSKHIQLFSQDPQSADKTLNEYGVTRRSRALNVIALTKRTIRAMMLFSSTGWIQYFLWIFKLIFTLPFVKNNMVFQLSGLGNR